MNSKPVAWMQTWENQDGELKKTVNIEQIGKNDIPLYTHPAELTDEEIWGIAREYFVGKSEFVYGFARAILRKAQEPLGAKFEKVLSDNLWEMLEEDGKAQEKPASKCSDSYDTVCPPSICDCRGKEQA